MKTLICITVSVFFFLDIHAQSDYYWVGGSGSWSDLNHWATTSGGSTNYGVLPDTDDNVIFDANSFNGDDQTLTLDVDGICHDMNWTGILYDVSIQEGAENEIQIYGSVALSNLVEIGNDVDFTLLSSGSETFSMGDNPEVRKNTGNNRTRIVFEGDGTWTVQDHLTSEGSIQAQGNATLDLNGKAMYTQDIDFLGSSTLITGDNATLTFEDWRSTTSNLTFGSNVVMTLQQFNLFDLNGDFTGGDNTFPTLIIDNADQLIRLDGSNTFDELVLEPGVTIEFQNAETQTVSTFTADGTKFDLITIKSDNSGQQATISQSSGTVDLTFVDLKDMVATGGATFNASNSFDSGNNSGWNITNPTGQDYYWVGDGGDWTDLSHWVTSSGGSTQHSELPGFIDNIYFDANSFSTSGQVVEDNDVVNGHDFDLSGVDESPEFDLSDVNVYGSFDLGDGVIFDGSVKLFSTGSETITSNNAAGFGTVEFLASGTYTVTDFTHFDRLYVNEEGTLIIDNGEIDVVFMYLEDDGALSAQNATITTATLSISGGGTHDFTGSSLIIEPTQFLTGITWSNHSLNIYPDVSVTFGDVTFNGGFDFYYGAPINIDHWTIPAGIEMVFADDLGTQINFNTLTADGTSNDHIIFRSIVDGYQYTLNSSSGSTVNVSWMELEDCVATGATFNADNSFDNGNNTGWNITAPPDVPDAPTNLMSTSIGETSFTAEWDAVDGAAGYRIDVDDFSAFATPLIEDQEVTGTSYEVTGLNDADEYFWRVRAVNVSGTSSNSTTASLTTLPQTPVALSAESVFANRFTAKWQEVDGADGYRLDVSTDNTFSSFESGYENLEVVGTSQLVEDLTQDTEYFYRVRAENVSGSTSNSNTISVSTTAKQDQTITFDLGSNASKTFGDDPFILTGSASSGLNVSYDTDNETVATIIDDEVTIVGAGTVTITASQDGDDNFNPADPVDQLLTVEKKDQVITVVPDPVPDQNFTDGSVSLDISIDTGLPLTVLADGPGTVEESGTPGTYEITFTGSGTIEITIEQAGTDDYNTAEETIPINVIDDSKDDQTITFDLGDDAEKTFGDDAFQLTAIATSGLGITYSVDDESVATVDGSTVTIVGAGTATLTASQSGNDDFNPAPSVEQTLTVSKADQTISFGSLPELTYGDGDLVLTATVSSGLPITYSIENSFLASISDDVLSILSAGSTTIIASQAGNDNYNAATSVEQPITINKAEQTITFSPATIEDKLITDESFTITVTVSSGLNLNVEPNEQVELSETGNEDEYLVELMQSGVATITASQTGTSNYQAAEVDISFEISKLDQTISFGELDTKTFGDDNFTLGATSSSGLEVSYSSSNTGVATINGNEVTIFGAGETTITASQSGNETYNAAAEVQQTLSVSKAGQTISFELGTDSEKTYGDDTFVLSGSSTSGLSVAYSSSDMNVATITGDEVTIVGAGSVVITASQEGDDNYLAATEVSQELTVEKASQVISFDALPDIDLNEQTEVTLNATANSGLTVTYAVAGPVTIEGNVITLTGAGTVEVTASQEGNANYAAAEPVIRTFEIIDSSKQSQTITFEAPATKTFGDDPFELTASASSGLSVSFSSSDEAVATITEGVVTILGAGSTMITASQEGNNDFAAAEPVMHELTVLKASQVIAFDEIPEKSIEEESFELSASASSGLTVSFSISDESVATISGNLVTLVGEGTATITAMQEGDNNFDPAESVERTLIVSSKVTQSISFTAPEEKTFGDDPFELTASASSGLPVTFTSSNESVATVAGSLVTIVGTGSTMITASQEGNDDFLPAESVTHELVVAKASQSITFEEIPEKSLLDEPFELEASASSGLSVSFESSNTEVASISGNVVTILSEGNTTITATQEGNSNYLAADPVEQELIVMGKSSQTITFEPLEERTFGDEPFELEATASSGLGVSFSSSNENVASVSGNLVTIIGAGTTTITASQDGNDEFLPASEVSQILLVNKADQEIEFTGIDDIEIGTVETVQLNASATSGLPVSFEVDGPAILEGSSLTIEAVGTVVVTANQSGDENYMAAEPVTVEFDVLASEVLSQVKLNQVPTVYPNPASDHINLAVESTGRGVIYDLNGRRMLQFEGKETGVGHLQSGVYYLHYELNGKQSIQKIIIE